jgi:hypothetical protein
VAQDIIGLAGEAKYTSIRDAAPPTVDDPYRPEDPAVVQVRTHLDVARLTATPLRWNSEPLRGRRTFARNRTSPGWSCGDWSGR